MSKSEETQVNFLSKCCKEASKTESVDELIKSAGFCPKFCFIICIVGCILFGTCVILFDQLLLLKSINSILVELKHVFSYSWSGIFNYGDNLIKFYG